MASIARALMRPLPVVVGGGRGSVQPGAKAAQLMLRRLQLALKLMLPLTRGCRLVSSRIVGRARLPRLMLRRLQLLAEFLQLRLPRRGSCRRLLLPLSLLLLLLVLLLRGALRRGTSRHLRRRRDPFLQLHQLRLRRLHSVLPLLLSGPKRDRLLARRLLGPLHRRHVLLCLAQLLLELRHLRFPRLGSRPLLLQHHTHPRCLILQRPFTGRLHPPRLQTPLHLGPVTGHSLNVLHHTFHSPWLPPNAGGARRPAQMSAEWSGNKDAVLIGLDTLYG
mmetsp:Transcript_16039/g.28530  ORF Transcript_16039/g.28530 Transcript_16039/m.28530 type:complete len:277 (+) Transcript_16039:307-1137(+)